MVAAACPPGTIPESARFMHAYFDYERNVFVCVFEDDSFEVVPEGCVIPRDVLRTDDYSKTTWHYADANGNAVTADQYATHVANATP